MGARLAMTVTSSGICGWQACAGVDSMWISVSPSLFRPVNCPASSL
jgi:hypothetical protein